jgi:cytochrome d ubiquinol oxidase subunit I
MYLASTAILATTGDSANVVLARSQMASTLGFHIILACMGIAFPTIVLVAEYI